MGQNASESLHFRLFVEEENAETLEYWRARLQSFDVTVERQTTRSIDAYGTKPQIEEALDVEIEDSPEGPVIRSAPKADVQGTTVPVNAYIPRKPRYF